MAAPHAFARNTRMFEHTTPRRGLPFWLSLGILALCAGPVSAQQPPANGAPPSRKLSIVHKVAAASEKIEMTVNSSRILTMDQRIAQAQVNNPGVLDVTPLSPTEIQVSAKTAGMTQVNLWGEDKKIFTVDVVVLGDAQALTYLLEREFPQAQIKVIPVANGALLAGYVDKPEHVDLITRIAEEFYPRVINNITVGGVQQVLLHVKIMEVSRTKLRRLGFDFAKITNGNVVASGISGLVQMASVSASGISTTGAQTFQFGVMEGASGFFGVLDALRQDDLAKILAEPTLVTISGRPAQFNSGGEFPIPVPQSLGTISIEYKKFGTQLDFVPIVLGNGNIRLEVRPRVSEIDRSRSVVLQGTTVPALRIREAETGVEMQAGQTLAIAGLVYSRSEAQNRGLPWISEVPYLGAPFRKVSEETNEIELLIMVTPEVVEPMNARETPRCGPGMQTTSPNDVELFLKGHLEVPNCCPNCEGAGCAQCSGRPQAPQDGMIGPVEAAQPQAEPKPAPAPNAAASRQNRANPNKAAAAAGPGGEPAFIGPVGYDMLN